MTLIAAPAPPSIIKQPTSQTVVAGKSATFSVTASGTSPLSYQWNKNGAPISGATSASYTTPPTTALDDQSQFVVVVSNVAGSLTSAVATLTVNVPPSIVTQPVSQTVIAGQTATFSVAATGTSPLSYQWMNNGTFISGATSSSYTTPPTTTSDSGELFTVVVGNSVGNATSSAALLAVNAPGQLTPSPSALNFGNVLTGTSSTVVVSVTNSGGASVTILNTTIAGAGFAASGASGQVLAPGQNTTLTVTFAPADIGIAAGSIVLASTAANSPTTIALSGSGVQPGLHSVSLAWSESSSNVFGYNIYRATISGGPYALLSLAPITPTQYLDTDVTAGQIYYYVVTALDSMNTESAYSNEASATIPTP